jgi:uncharacterized protein (DUF1330 family)
MMKAMPKTYWIATYRSIRDPDAMAAHAKLAAPALISGGARLLVRGMPAHVYELGINERVVVWEFDSVAYQEALRALGNGAERDLRIVEGVG